MDKMMIQIYYQNKNVKCEGDFSGWKLADMPELQAGGHMTEQNRKYITKEIGKLLSEI